MTRLARRMKPSEIRRLLKLRAHARRARALARYDSLRLSCLLLKGLTVADLEPGFEDVASVWHDAGELDDSEATWS